MKQTLLLITVIILGFTVRFFQLGINPPSLSWDEASLGYNAYTILTSGRDEHGEFLPVSRFIAFGDYKPPGYIYASVPAVFLFGLTEFAVRLPSAVAGVIMILICYLLTYELFGKRTIALLAAFLLAVSPWSIQFSRAAFEAHLAALFNLMGVYFFILSRRKKRSILLSGLFFLLSFYTFNANRIIAFLLMGILSIIYIKDLRRNLLWTFITYLITILMVLPSIPYLRSREGQLRFQEVTIFNNLEPVELSNNRIETDGNSLPAKILHNRRIMFASDFLKHYMDNFSGRFLFTHGDVNPRLSIQEMGELYAWELPFLLTGIYLLVKRRNSALLPLLSWIIIAPIPAATARETPHALRTLSLLPAFQIIESFGIYGILVYLKSKITSFGYSSLTFVSAAVMILSFFYYLHSYFIHYPVNWSGEWQYGYKEMVNFVAPRQNSYDHIFVTDALGRPYIYFAFYRRYPVEKFLADRQATRDWFGFWNVNSLGNINFGLTGLSRASGKILLVTSEKKLPSGFNRLETVKNLAGDDVFTIAEKI